LKYKGGTKDVRTMQTTKVTINPDRRNRENNPYDRNEDDEFEML
jgi:hypothetical protein